MSSKSSAITRTSEITLTPVGGVTLLRENAGAPALVGVTLTLITSRPLPRRNVL